MVSELPRKFKKREDGLLRQCILTLAFYCIDMVRIAGGHCACAVFFFSFL